MKWCIIGVEIEITIDSRRIWWVEDHGPSFGLEPITKSEVRERKDYIHTIELKKLESRGELLGL